MSQTTFYIIMGIAYALFLAVAVFLVWRRKKAKNASSGLSSTGIMANFNKMIAKSAPKTPAQKPAPAKPVDPLELLEKGQLPVQGKQAPPPVVPAAVVSAPPPIVQEPPPVKVVETTIPATTIPGVVFEKAPQIDNNKLIADALAELSLKIDGLSGRLTDIESKQSQSQPPPAVDKPVQARPARSRRKKAVENG